MRCCDFGGVTLLLLIQQKLTNLTIDERYSLNVALRMFTRRIVIQRLVEDLQLGVESYQKKLNLTKPYTFSDGTLDDVRSALNDIAKGIRMEYLPMRNWSNLDKKRARVMITKSLTTSVETSNNEIPSHEGEVFHKVSESFQEESSSSSLNDDVQQSLEEVMVPPTNTQSSSNNMVPSVNEASSSHNVIEPANVAEALKHADWVSAIMMGEMKFFLGLQVNQFSNGIFINQSKYILDILKRFGMENCDTVPTPMVEQAKLKLDLVGKPVDHTDYRSMIGSLMYLTSSRPDIMFATCLWYSKDSGFDLTAYSDVDHAGCHLDQKILWIRTQLTDYGFFYDKVPIYCDSKSAIAISCNPVQHTQTKHIDVRWCLEVFLAHLKARLTSDLFAITIIMAPKKAPALTEANINRLIQERIDEAIAAERERVRNENNLEVPPPAPTPAPTTDPATNPAPGSAAGLTAGTATRECTFAGFLKCNPTSFHGNEGAVGLSRWIEKSESVFDISKCAEGNKVIFAAATLQDSALTWWNNQVASMGRAVSNSKS
ncbi:hypothetical protein Tco_0627464 [Tanacetum coccineum]|uniref:Reverse transcriptase Ty1/copia-type domain-containing protein n=1 Tax=Tanacetum coccineum TaxID=301880 RepID=A0ABQ4WMM1_9ASTR